MPGGLAASTGLLAVNDEVLEVNSIDVTGKTLDQVTDMMVANASNLIVTVKPVNAGTLGGGLCCLLITPSLTFRYSTLFEHCGELGTSCHTLLERFPPVRTR